MPNLEYRENLPAGGYFYEFNKAVHTYSRYRDNVTWDNKWYWADGINTGKMLSDGTEMDLGIATPTIPCDLNGVIDGRHTGAFKYTYTFYSTDTGIESAPAPLQKEYLNTASEDIEVSNMEPLPANADMYRLYRIGGYLPYFTLVRELTSNNLFLDDIDDTQVDGRHIQTMQSGLPPAGLQNITEFNGRFYGSVGNKVYYSALGNPDAWYNSDYFVARDYIVAIANSPGGILVMGRFFTMMMYGTQPTDYKMKTLSDHLGCIDKRSLAYLGDSAIWLSHRSFVMSNGYSVTDITAHKIDNLRGFIPTSAIVDDNTYYMSFAPALVPMDDLFPEDTLYPNLIEGTAGLDEGIIAMDFKRGNGYSYKVISNEDMIALGMVRGEAHVSTGTAKGSSIPCDDVMFPTCLDPLSCSDYALNRMSVYNGQGLAPLKYLSPKLVDGSLGMLKQYDKVRIFYTGLFDIKVIFDDGHTVVEQTMANLNDTDGFAIIGIPNNNNLSHSVRFLIEGVGIIYSIQYSWKEREILT
jgi:hypothetical protein